MDSAPIQSQLAAGTWSSRLGICKSSSGQNRVPDSTPHPRKAAVVSATQKLLRFGVFELNVDTEELRKSGTLVKLPPQSFKLLVLLASRAGLIVSRDEIQKQLWYGDTFVDFEHGVNRCINQIRNVLSDHAEHPFYIETLPRQGYRFVAPVVSKTIAAPKPLIIESHSGERTRTPALAVSATPAPAPNYSSAAPQLATVPEQKVEPLAEARPRSRGSLVVWSSVAALLIAAIAGVLYWRAHRVHALTEKDTVVVAEFDNKTGDIVFDGALREGLTAQLQQSPFLNLLSDQRIADTLALTTRPRDARLTEELAREVCQRTDSAATIEGSISGLGNLYIVGVRAVDCHNGELLADEQVTAADKEHVEVALSQAATQLRKKLGESLASVEKHDVPLESVTTPSLEALRDYSLGYRALTSSLTWRPPSSSSSRPLTWIQILPWPMRGWEKTTPTWASRHARLRTSARLINCAIAWTSTRSSISTPTIKTR